MKIEKITILGNHEFSTARIKDAMKRIREGSSLASNKSETGRAAESRYFITINIDENEQYRVGDVKIVGNQQFTNDEIRKVVGLAPSQIFNETLLRQNFDKLKKLYESRGFNNFAPEPELEMDASPKLVYLTIHIREGEKKNR